MPQMWGDMAADCSWPLIPQGGTVMIGQMNKLAAPMCTACAGDGVVIVPRSLTLPPDAPIEHPRAVKAGAGFVWVRCAACQGSGRR